jgi:hypothetical protein
LTACAGGPISTPIAPRAAATARIPGTADPTVSADSVIRQLFAISITLASCAKTTDMLVASRVMQAIDGLDRVISDLRSAIIDEVGTAEQARAGLQP